MFGVILVQRKSYLKGEKNKIKGRKWKKTGYLKKPEKMVLFLPPILYQEFSACAGPSEWELPNPEEREKGWWNRLQEESSGG